MRSFTKDEFQRLVEELTAQQYGDEIDAPEEEEIVWMPADPPAKDKIKLPSNSGVMDLTKVKKDQIKDALYKCTSLKVGNFTIKITKYHGYPDKNGKGQDLKMDLSFWHEVYKTPSGAPCKMTYRFEIGKDSRFAGRPWLLYQFGTSGMKDVPADVVVEVIRWFQGVTRMTAFL
jgi:hypothetical protein